MKITARSDIQFVDNNSSTSSSSSNRSDRCYAWLDGASYAPAKNNKKNKKKQIKSNNADCLTGRWLAAKETIRVKTWAVMAVFKKLNENDKLPQSVISAILTLAQSKEIFQESEDEMDVNENKENNKRDFPSPSIGLGDTANKPANPPNLNVSVTNDVQSNCTTRRRSSRRQTSNLYS
jgi:hypothetical protein